MATALDQILGADNLTRTIETVSGGVPQLLPPAFLTPTDQVEGDTAAYMKVASSRRTSRVTTYGAPSVMVTATGESMQALRLLHSAEHEFHAIAVLNNLMSENGGRQRMGKQRLVRQSANFKRRRENLRTSAIYSALVHGAVYADGNGNLLVDSTGAVLSADFGVSANHKNQLNGIIAASWATAGTAIHKHIDALQKQSRKDTGHVLTEAFHGSDTLDYFLGNTKLKELINRNTGFQASVAGGTIPNGFLGFNWHPASGAFFEDQDGTTQDFWASDIIVFTPPPSPSWYLLIEGSLAVANSLGNLSPDTPGALADLTMKFGMVSYAKIVDDPVRIKHVAYDTFMPVIANPDAIYIADVVF